MLLSRHFRLFFMQFPYNWHFVIDLILIFKSVSIEQENLHRAGSRRSSLSSCTPYGLAASGGIGGGGGSGIGIGSGSGSGGGGGVVSCVGGNRGGGVRQQWWE